MIKTKWLGSLAFRVLFVSILFIVVPLICYAFFGYDKNYKEKLNDVIEEMHIFQRDSYNLLDEIERSTKIFLSLLEEIIKHVQIEHNKNSLDKIDKLLSEFSEKKEINSLFFSVYKNEKELICTNSNNSSFLGKDLSEIFDAEKLNSITSHVFLAKNFEGSYSLYIFQPNENRIENKHGYLFAEIKLIDLVSKLNTTQTKTNGNVSIVDENFKIIASTNKNRINEELDFVSNFTRKKRDKKIEVKKIEGVNHGYEFYYGGKKRFLTYISFPNTTAKIILTIPEENVLIALFKLFKELSSLLLFILVIGGITSYLLTIRFAKPLIQLKEVMEKVGHGNLDVRFIPDKVGFEINLLGKQFNEMCISLVNYIEEVKKERAFKEAYQKELQIGREIQKSLLPEGNIVFEGIETSIFFQPAKEVAGDFYDWLIKNDEIFLNIADGVGKGISGCLYAFDLRSSLRTLETIYEDLAFIAKQTNVIFLEDTKDSGSFVTAFLSKYDRKTKELTYLNCGHNYPFLRRKNGVIEKLQTPGIAFGVDNFYDLEVKKITLESGDFIVYYTDGLTEAQDINDKLFGEKRVIQLLETNSYQNPKELMDLIVNEISLFAKDRDPYDDITIIILKIT
jgi:sigma-B regulation protein RsbU (phosphoserine phosphatase)